MFIPFNVNDILETRTRPSHFGMPKDVTKGVSDLSIQPEGIGSSAKQYQRKKSYRCEEWIYGFHLKNKHCRIIAQKHGLPWKKRPLITMQRVVDHIMFVSRCTFRVRTVAYGNDTAMILYFIESDGRKRMKNSLASEAEMDRVRKALYLPKGTKPKWFNCFGCDEHDNFAGSSDDEDLPVSRARAPPPAEPSQSDKASESSQDSDASMNSDSGDDDDSDESSSDDDSEEEDSDSET